jgi:PAS domain S-box-containing protein
MRTKASNHFSTLRTRAEKSLPDRQADQVLWPLADDPVRLIHELRVHQAELEMQNDELQQAVADLATSKSRYQELYDGLPVGYITVNPLGEIQEVNRTLAQMLRTDCQSLIDQPLARFLTSNSADVFYVHLNTAGGLRISRSCKLEMRRCDDTNFYARLHTLRIDDEQGESLGFRISISDINALEQAHQLASLALHVAEEERVSKTHLLSRVSHELRTPLHHIAGFGQILSMAPASQISQEHAVHIQHILNASARLTTLVDQLLDLQAIEAGSVNMELEQVGLESVLSECLHQLGAQIDAQCIAIEMDATRWPSATVLADRTRLKQAIFSLLDNAVKYNTQGGRIQLFVEHRTGERLRLHVCNTGRGVSPESVSSLFQPFHHPGQGETPNTPSGPRLGLALTKRIIDEMNGSIGYEDRLDSITEFWIELPST